MRVDIYNQKGEHAGTIELPKEIFSLQWKPDLVHQVAESMRSNARRVVAHAKGRGEVRGGGRKPWRQKGTGRARHGSIRSPLWIGGGVTHGPKKEKVYSKKINKKMKQKALLVSLSKKLKDNEILFLDNLELEEARTKKAQEILLNLGSISGFEFLKRKAPSVLILLAKPEIKIMRAFRNLPKVKIKEARNVNILDLLSSRYLIFPKESLNVISSTFLRQ